MDYSESNKLTEVTTDVKWLKAEIPKSIEQVLQEVRGIGGRVDALEKRITLNEQYIIEAKIKVEDHIKDAAPLVTEHKENTRFRRDTELILRLGKWLVPPSFIANIFTAIILFSGNT